MFSLLLNLPWEFWQSPFFAGLAEGPHWNGVVLCTRAALGDAFISLLAYWVVCATVGTRQWVMRPTRVQVALFVGVGLAVTVLLEVFATRVFDRWSYSDAMTVVPGTGIGLVPFVQWLLLPPVVLWFVRRQLD